MLFIPYNIRPFNQEHSGDSTIITMILKSLMSEMKTELDDIQRIQQLTSDFTTEMADLGQWLEKKPDITQLVALRKSIKGLKSKLRHKVADKVDLEEVGGICGIFCKLYLIRNVSRRYD